MTEICPRRLVALAALLAALVVPAVAQPAAPAAESTLGADEARGSLVGYAVALDGDRALVGAPSDDQAASASGAAHVYVRTRAGWAREGRLALPDATADDYFGISVALDGDRALVGAYGRGENRGAAYLYARTDAGWALEAALSLPDAAPGDRFGVAVALDGDRALVGAHGRDGGRGRVAVFERAGGEWAQQAALALPDAAANDYFGWSVALDGDRALVGARGRDGGRGTAVVFALGPDGWAEEARLDGAAPGDNAGVSVALDGRRALVGAPFADAGARDAGAVTAFVRTADAWTEEATLSAADAEASDYFGWSVALDGGRALVGVRLADGGGANSGGAVVFDRGGSGWAEAARLGGGAIGDNAGLAVALGGGRALVGAPYTDAGRGAARAFALGAAAAACGAGSPLVIGTFVTGPDKEVVELTAGPAGRAVALAGCRLVALDPHTRAVTFAADAAGTVSPGAPVTFATAGGDRALPAHALPDGPGAVALVAGPVAVGDPVEALRGRVVAAVVYRGVEEVGRLGGSGTQGAEAFEDAFNGLLSTASEPEASARLAVAAAPNPTAGDATVTFEVPEAADVRVSVFDALGREVAVLAEGARGPGRHRVGLGGGALAAGPYVVRVVARGAAGVSAQTARLTVVR